jgi:isochorismate synthase EntC
MGEIPLGILMNITNWFDDFFFQTGCFFSLDKKDKIILAKGGSWKTKPSKSLIQFEIRDFYSHEKKYYHPDNIIFATLSEIQAALPQVPLNFELTDEQKFEDEFQKDFKLYRAARPELKKAVLMSRIEYKVDRPENLKKHAIHQALFTTIGEPYGFWENQYAIIGSTPEILFDCEGDLIKSFALAGTAPVSEGAELLLSKKNRHEHDLVIQNIMEDLAPFCVELQSLNTHTASYGRLVHLKTLIEGKLKMNFNSDELINAMSPTAALGGYPRHKAKPFLLKTEYYKAFPDRFHGSVFKVSYHNNERSLVMIRNIQLKDNKLILEAGAGVVDASLEKSELNEIYQKIEATRDILI